MLMETRTPLKKEESIGEAETVMKSNVVDWQYLTPGEKHAQKRREAERAVHFMADSCASPSLFREAPSTTSDDDATYDSHVDDGFEDTQEENMFSQEDYYKY